MSNASGSSSTFVSVSADPVSTISGEVEEKACQHCLKPIRGHATLALPQETVWVCGAEPAVVVHRRLRP